MADTSLTIVGAGVVGLAVAARLATDFPDLVILERNDRHGQETSSRNSEVIHAGLYYPTGSLKARLCVEGRRRLYEFLDAHHVACDKCGKLVVAVEDAELDRLDAILAQSRLNDVEGVVELTGAKARALEPELRASAALLSRESGVFHSHGYMLALQGELEDSGGLIALGAPFERAIPLRGGGFTIRADGAESAEITARRLVIAAGLGAQAA